MSPHLLEQRCGRFCYKHDDLSAVDVVNITSQKVNSQCHKVGKKQSEGTCQVPGAGLIAFI